MSPRVLVIDDERNYLVVLRELLERDGYEVQAVTEPLEGLKLAGRQSFDCALIDLRMGELDGLEVLRRLRRLDPHLSVVIMTAYATVETAVESIKSGAVDYVLKPFDNDVVLRVLHRSAAMTRLARENERLRETVRVEAPSRELLARSAAMAEVQRLVSQVAPTDTTVLITGETGTGKEVVARAIHDASPRQGEPFVAVNCAALAESVLESELFGHERGAFTGAVARKRGRFELATGGTLFLDEIGEISPAVQAKLLRAIESRSFERVGGETSIHTDARFIAATNRDLDEARKQGRFREDLYYRLNVVHIRIPPLRERREDIEVLAPYFLRRYGARMQRPGAHLGAHALELLVAYDWPGNVRELENVLERALVLAEGDRIGPEVLPAEIRDPARRPGDIDAFRGKPLQEALDQLEKELILRALEDCDYVQSRAAQRLGLSKSALHYKLTKHQIRSGVGQG